MTPTSPTLAVLATLLAAGPLLASPALAQASAPSQTTPATPDVTPPVPERVPSAGASGPQGQTPGTGQGVLRPPPGVDPGMVTPPPATQTPTMPVIKPPAGAR